MKQSRHGLTLIEMAIVLLVMSMVTSVLVWMLRSFSTLRTGTDEAQALSQVYTFARRAAIKSGETVFLELNLD